VYHSLFWLSLFGVLLFLGKETERNWWFIYSNEIINLLFFAIIVYFNLLFLIPNYLAKNKVFIYLLLLSLSVLLITPLKMMVYYAKFDGLPTEYRASLIANQSRFFLANGLIAFGSTILKIITDWFRSQEERRNLLTQNMQSELRFLRSQINPHFLFNTLNSLYALTLKKSEKAPEIVLKLSEIMRYMLYECNERRVFLNKEIQYIRNHLDLEKLRLQRNMDITFVVDGEVSDQQIAPLMFIPFLENAFKHGLSNHISDGFCHIRLKIEAETVVFFIENSKPDRIPKSNHPQVGGIGLSNIKQRLALLYPNNHELLITDAPDIYQVNLTLSLN
jgi:two-component system, LytTR family, sensor kinase